MYTYPEALNASQRLVSDLLRRAGRKDVYVNVIADAYTGTASVDWHFASDPHGYSYVNIRMPVRPATYRMSQGEFDHWAAYLLHEIGHPFHTDKVVWNDAVATRRHRLLNSLEDVRSEKATIDMGLAFNARQAFSALISSLHVKAIADGYDPNDIRSLGWTMSTLGRHANGYDVDVSDIHNRLKPEGAIAKMLEWGLPALKACKSTQDCLDLVDLVSKALAKPEPVQEPEEEQGDDAQQDDAQQGEGDEDAQEGSGEAQEGAQSENEAQTGEDSGNEQNASGEAQEGEGNDHGKSAGTDKDDTNGKPEGEAEKDALDDSDFDDVSLVPNHNSDMAANSYDANIQKRLIDMLRDALNDQSSPREIPSSRNGSFAYVTNHAAKMGKQRGLLAQALRQAEMDDYEGNRAHGRFDRRAVAKAVAGSPNVFGRRTVTEGYDTDVEILVDGSGSMSGYNIAAASVLALVVAQAASQVGADCATHLFNDHGLHEATKGKRKPDGKRFAGMTGRIMGGTPLTRNMVKVAQMQARRATGKRKVLFVITDGACNCGPATVKMAGQYIESQLDIEIANLHIGPMVMGLFRNEVAVDVDNVAAIGLKKLTDVLKKGA